MRVHVKGIAWRESTFPGATTQCSTYLFHEYRLRNLLFMKAVRNQILLFLFTERTHIFILTSGPDPGTLGVVTSGPGTLGVV